MNANQNGSATPSPFERVANSAFSGIEVDPPEVVALREARQRAVTARIDAANALREAEEAEARLLAQEEEAVFAALTARRERAAEAARLAAENERVAADRVAVLETEFQRCSQTKENVETAARSVMQSRDEAQLALDRLTASLAEFEDRLREAEANERSLELELTASRRAAEEMTRARERAEAAIPPAAGPVPIASTVVAPGEAAQKAGVSSAVWPISSNIGDPFAIAAQRAQRAAERRAADAARGQSNS